MNNLFKSLTVFILSVFVVSVSDAEVSAVNEAAIEQAAVIKDSMNVYARMSARGRVVKHLQKGDMVTVEFEINNADGAWCGIKRKNQTKLLGYVKCEFLDRKAAQKNTWKLVSAVTVHKGSSPEPDDARTQNARSQKRPYSDITAILYMTTW
jgi:hypothetical protein